MSHELRRFAAAALFATVLPLAPGPALEARPLPVSTTDAREAPARREPGLWHLLWQAIRNVWGEDAPVLDPNGKH